MPIKHEIDFGNNDSEAAELIHRAGKYHSWTIIISFYSCLHFVRGKIFPITETIGSKSVLVATFAEYCTIHGAENSSKHQKLLKLVAQYLPSIAVEFKWLFDNSTTARYRFYLFDPSYAEQALKYLGQVKAACS